MARRISLEPHLTIEELEGRSRSTKDPVERSRWHFLWLLARGLTATVIASITEYSAHWIGHIARRYNQHGPDGVKDLRDCPSVTQWVHLFQTFDRELPVALSVAAHAVADGRVQYR